MAWCPIPASVAGVGIFLMKGDVTLPAGCPRFAPRFSALTWGRQRIKRSARGSGTSVQEVNHLLRQYAQMRKMFKGMGKPSFARRMAGMKMPGM